MSGSLRYICQFCQIAASYEGYYSTSFNRAEWYKCYKCNVFYTIAQNGRLLELSFNCIIDHKEYQYQINYENNSSRIVLLPENANDTIIIIADFKSTPILKKKPTDLEHKIKTYITFS